jgi:hypothetical protein
MGLYANTLGAAAHLAGIRWGVFIFSFANLVSLIFAINIEETGPGKNLTDEPEEETILMDTK